MLERIRLQTRGSFTLLKPRSVRSERIRSLILVGVDTDMFSCKFYLLRSQVQVVFSTDSYLSYLNPVLRISISFKSRFCLFLGLETVVTIRRPIHQI